MKKWFVTWVITLFTLSPLVMADQLEREQHEGVQPQGVLVKTDPVNHLVEVFQAPVISEKVINKTATEDEMNAEIRNIATANNRIAQFRVSTHELDREASTSAWWYRRGWGWNGWGGYYPYSYSYYNPYRYAGYFNYGYYGYQGYYPYRYCYGYGCGYGWYY